MNNFAIEVITGMVMGIHIWIPWKSHGINRKNENRNAGEWETSLIGVEIARIPWLLQFKNDKLILNLRWHHTWCSCISIPMHEGPLLHVTSSEEKCSWSCWQVLAKMGDGNIRQTTSKSSIKAEEVPDFVTCCLWDWSLQTIKLCHFMSSWGLVLC